MMRLDTGRPLFNAGLLSLSLRHTDRHAGRRHTPMPPTNDERRRALLAVWPMQRGNDYRWPMK